MHSDMERFENTDQTFIMYGRTRRLVSNGVPSQIKLLITANRHSDSEANGRAKFQQNFLTRSALQYRRIKKSSRAGKASRH